MTEDEVYRASTQYRLWSYTPESLISLRQTTNKTASERVKAAIQRSKINVESSDEVTPLDVQVDCLTSYEELALVQFYCEKCGQISDYFKFPTAVKATAIQYIKRFYLSNSPMTYHPKSMFPTALFLATKTENNYISLANFAAKIPKTTPEDVVAPEFILTQGLRFTFDVRHPHRGLRGGLMELLAMARAEEGILLPGLGKSAKEVQSEMIKLSLAADKDATLTTKTPKDLENRCGRAHDAAKDTLAGAALLTDVYFLYTPAQIWLAALMLADEPLTLYYLSTKFPGVPSASDPHVRILTLLRTCAEVLTSHTSMLRKESRDELVRIDKKLYQCQNPEKRDLVGLNRAAKADGGGGDRKGPEDADERAAKKRRKEREMMEQTGDVFGGVIGEGKSEIRG